MSWCYLNLTFDPVVVFLTFEILLSCVSETGVGILVISTLKKLYCWTGYPVNRGVQI